MSGRVRVVNRLNVFSGLLEAAMERALDKMGTDIYMMSQFKVPLKGGGLRSTGRKERMARLRRRVSYGGAYAEYQHRGMRRDGSHVVRRYTSSGTGKGYLSDSGDKIAKKATAYFKAEADSVRM